MIASVALVAKTPANPPATDVAIVEAAVDEPIALAAAAVVTAAFDAAAAIPATIAEIVILNNPPRRDLLLEFFFRYTPIPIVQIQIVQDFNKGMRW